MQSLCICAALLWRLLWLKVVFKMTLGLLTGWLMNYRQLQDYSRPAKVCGHQRMGCGEQ